MLCSRNLQSVNREIYARKFTAHLGPRPDHAAESRAAPPQRIMLSSLCTIEIDQPLSAPVVEISAGQEERLQTAMALREDVGIAVLSMVLQYSVMAATPHVYQQAMSSTFPPNPKSVRLLSAALPLHAWHPSWTSQPYLAQGSWPLAM